jgi:hypothetical protein
MNGLTPLIDLATQKSLDLFFRVGQGYVARLADPAHRAPGHGLSPNGVQARAHVRIVSALPPPLPGQLLHAWPVAGARPRPPAA